MLDSNLLRDSEQKYIVADCETEGLSLFHVRPWSLAWVVCQGTNILERHNHFLKWKDLKVSPGAARATNFNPEVIEKEGEDPLKIIELFYSYLNNPNFYIVIHNGLNYDVYILNTSRRQLGLKEDFDFLKRFYDSNAIARAIEMKIPFRRNKDEILEFQYKLANSPRKGIKTSLATLARKFELGINEANLHGAAFDCDVNHKIWCRLVRLIDL